MPECASQSPQARDGTSDTYSRRGILATHLFSVFCWFHRASAPPLRFLFFCRYFFILHKASISAFLVMSILCTSEKLFLPAGIQENKNSFSIFFLAHMGGRTSETFMLF